MAEAGKRLLVLDETGILPAEILERPPQRDVVHRVRTVVDLQNQLAHEGFRAVLIAMGGTPYVALALAFHVRERRPDAAVMLLGGLDAELRQKASARGIEVIGKAGDAEALCVRIAERWSPAAARTRGTDAAVVRA
jgi:hypothetical protein